MPAGRTASADWEREFLGTARTPAKEEQRLDRIVREFSNGFDMLREGAISIEDTGFGYLTDSPAEAVRMILSSRRPL